MPSLEEYPLNTDAVGSAPPDAFGPFRVLHQIGAGALGPVYRAYQPEQDRLVAVKLFRLDLPPERTHQLVAELQKLIAADLSHPGISAPLAAGISGVSAYLAQDFVAADSLDIVVRENGLSDPADIARIASQLGGALDLAAAIGITHGALHPRDVLMSSDDVRITGLGVTRALELVGIAAPVRRPYTAPERAAGEPWDRRADVFSLAALLFELLFRRRIAGAGDQAVEAIKDVAGANPAALRRAFARALAEDPGDRFATAGEFAKALRAAFEAKPPAAGRSSRSRTIPVAPIADPPPFVPPAFEPLPTADLPLLTDEMLSHSGKESPAADAAPPPIGDLPLSTAARGITVHDDGLLPDDFQLATTDARLSTIDHEPTPDDHPLVARDHRLAIDDHRLTTNDDQPAATNDQSLATRDFDVSEIFEPDVAEASSRPAIFEPSVAEDRSPSGVWPLMLALVVGIAIGFGMALLVLGGDRVPSASQQAQSSVSQSPAPTAIRDEPIREFTERAVPGPPTASPPAVALAQPAKPPTASASAAPAPITPRAGAPTPAGATTPPAATTKRPITPPAPASSSESRRSRPSVAKAPASAPSLASKPGEVRRGSPGQGRVGGSATPQRQVAKPATAPSARPTARAATAPPPPAVKTGPGSLAVDSRPAGASVFVDGKLIGTTPLVVPTMSVGEHAIHLDRSGYRRWSTAVRIASGERSRVAASLER